MNKKEQKAFDDLKEQLRIAKAFRFTDPIDPDVPPPPIGKGTETLSTGWHYNIYNQEVDRGCSSCIYHSTYSDTKTTSQGTIWLYSSKLLALQAMRAQIEREFAKKLADLDLLIEQENGGAEGP